MKQKTLVLLFIILLIIPRLKAVEGMWLPSMIQRNIEEMQQMGLQLNAEDLYSEDGVSFKDAIVRFGRGCTGAFISPNGLLVTNHHCGYGQIQRHSSVDNDYLTHGFWASSMDEELANDGLTVTILVRMEDVTDRVLEYVDEGLDEVSFQAAVDKISDKIIAEAREDGRYEAQVNPFYFGNEYYLFVYQVFRDVRMVGAPPSSIGKFGGDVDNWMWPRHSGDFMLFRVYADENNQPADYSPDNKPYSPAKFFNMSNRAHEENDFTMVYGFPGRTQRYLTSHAVEFIMEKENPMGIDLRTRILQIYEQHMAQSDAVRIKYASKHAGIANAWKKWMGENRGLQRLNAIQVKKEHEKEFEQWVDANPSKAADYKELIDAFETAYRDYHPYRFASRLYFEAARNVEVIRFAQQFSRLASLAGNEETTPEQLTEEMERMKGASQNFFKNYHPTLDREVLAELFRVYVRLSNQGFLPPVVESEFVKKYGNDSEAFADNIFKRSILVSEAKTMEFLNDFQPRHLKKLHKDPAFILAKGLSDFISIEVQAPMQQAQNRLDSLYRIYMRGLMKMKPDYNFFPDANSTLRITYGSIEGSYPRDGIKYRPFTTGEGILEKAADLTVEDYRISERLQTLLGNKVYADYATGNDLVVNFVASNHTTGGNSGSPVLDGQGNFIGINFDRSWESTMSDIMFDPEQCRNIAVSSRYILWVIDQYAGMEYLLDEMVIVD